MERLTLAVLDDQLPIKLAQEAGELDDIEIVWAGQSPDAMMDALPVLRPRVLVLQLEHLGSNPITRAQLLAKLAEAELTIVTYAFARREVLDALRSGSVRPVRVPLSAQDFRAQLTGVIVRSLTTEQADPPEEIPPPRYSLAKLAELEAISTNVECECPQHLSSLLTSLAYFERYCQDCENRNEDDAQLHRMLYEHTARARMILEEGLRQTLIHENISV